MYSMTNDSKHADAIRQISLHQPVLQAYILTLHPNRSEAQDILQETNVVLWQKIGEFRSGTNFKAWAFRVAYLQTLAHFKRVKRGGWLQFSDELVETLAEESEQVLNAPTTPCTKHSLDNCPTLIAGGGAGFKQGRHLVMQRKKTPLCKLWLSMLQGSGVNVDSFGASSGGIDTLFKT